MERQVISFGGNRDFSSVCGGDFLGAGENKKGEKGMVRGIRKEILQGSRLPCGCGGGKIVVKWDEEKGVARWMQNRSFGRFSDMKPFGADRNR